MMLILCGGRSDLGLTPHVDARELAENIGQSSHIKLAHTSQ
jgi:hypothetical protein